MYALLIMDSMIIHRIISKWWCLVWSVESRTSPFTMITISPLIQSAVDILFNSKNAATASKPNAVCVTTVLNYRNYCEHVLHTHSPLIISTSTGTQYLLLYLYYIYIRYHMIWTVWTLILFVLCMSRILWWQGTRGQTTGVLLLACYTAYNVIRVYIVRMLLTSISHASSSDSIGTRV